MTKPGIELKSQLVFCNVVGLREYFNFLDRHGFSDKFYQYRSQFEAKIRFDLETRIGT